LSPTDGKIVRWLRR